MEISSFLANNIVKEMKKIIGKDLNFIDSNGIIIASTNLERVNTFHEGAKEAISKNKTIKIMRDNEYNGAKKGINLPLKFNKELVGVIGISGETKEVEKYGQIIKKMAEILIKEACYQKKIEEENEEEKIILEALLLENLQPNNTIIFSKDFSKFEKKGSGSVISIKLLNNHLNSIKKTFSEIKNIVKKKDGFLMLNKTIITVLYFHNSKNDILKFLTPFLEKENLLIGVGELKKTYTDFKNSYSESITALDWGIKNKNKITFYQELELELIVKNLDFNTSSTYKNKIFKTLSQKEIQEVKEIFILYEKYNGSLQKIAFELNIHPNTLQYKLNKIAENINLDMRKYKDFSKLKIAFLIL